MSALETSTDTTSVRYPTFTTDLNSPVLTTSRLRLRRFTVDDAAFVLRLLNEPSFHEFIGDRGVRTLDDAAHYLEQGPIASCTQRGHGLLRVSLPDDTPIGMCGLLRRDGLEFPDLGFALVPEHWGKAYTLEASRAVMAHGRETLGFGTLLAITAPHNARSMHVLEKLGFSFVDSRPLMPGTPSVNVFRSDNMPR